MYADIIIDISHEKVDRVFQYAIPERLLDDIKVGTPVTIPFGKGNKLRMGYVIRISDKSGFDPKRIKYIEDISDKHLPITESLLAIAGFIKDRYGSTMINSIKTVMPIREKVREKSGRAIKLLIGKDEAVSLLAIYQKKHSARLRLISALIEVGEMPFDVVRDKLKVSLQTINAMSNDGILEILISREYRNPVKSGEQCARPDVTLSEEQRGIIETVQKERGIHLIHGITGSGKTQVYIEIAASVVERGKQVIMLIPEISLTYQTVMRFLKRFGNRVSIMNSKLSKGERYDQWERVRDGGIDVIIGPRSALFMPFERLGLIIIDEEHEGSYKSETMPKYHAREAAAHMAETSDIILLLGSATPSLEAYTDAENGIYKLHELTKRLTGGTLPHVQTADMRGELRAGNMSPLSNILRTLIEKNIKDGNKTMLFLNRRGYAGFISCRSCGYVEKCPHCAVSLSEHRSYNASKLICHYCGYSRDSVSKCPGCGSKYIGGFKAGTQQIEEYLNKELPYARIIRMDADTTREKDGFDKILTAFSDGGADILLGTQMIVKGHDFPDVTLVGILAADLSLGMPNFRAAERTFQLLTQAAGRAGRGAKPGNVIIQTYQPEHYSILHAVNQDYKAFYKEEFAYRSLMDYPPSGHMLAVLVFSKDAATGADLSNKLCKHIKAQVFHGTVIGPAAAAIEKINDIYRHVIYIKDRNIRELIAIKDGLEVYLEHTDLVDESVQFDFDPINFV